VRTQLHRSRTGRVVGVCRDAQDAHHEEVVSDLGRLRALGDEAEVGDLRLDPRLRAGGRADGEAAKSLVWEV
jgi:hypothetical protein